MPERAPERDYLIREQQKFLAALTVHPRVVKG